MKTLIWDFNGTIIDDARFCHQIETEMLVKRNMQTYSFEEYRDMFCFPVINYYYKMGYTFEEETYDDISIEFNALYDAGFPTLSVMDDFLQTIQHAARMGYQNMILSASRQDKLLHQCKELGIDSYFVEICGTDNIYGGSKIEVGKDLMQRRNLNPEECMFIGDSLHDKECANAIGIENVTLVATGHQSKEVLLKEYDNVVNHLSEVKIQ